MGLGEPRAEDGEGLILLVGGADDVGREAAQPDHPQLDPLQQAGDVVLGRLPDRGGLVEAEQVADQVVTDLPAVVGVDHHLVGGPGVGETTGDQPGSAQFVARHPVGAGGGVGSAVEVGPTVGAGAEQAVAVDEPGPADAGQRAEFVDGDRHRTLAGQQGHVGGAGGVEQAGEGAVRAPGPGGGGEDGGAGQPQQRPHRQRRTQRPAQVGPGRQAYRGEGRSHRHSARNTRAGRTRAACRAGTSATASATRRVPATRAARAAAGTTGAAGVPSLAARTDQERRPRTIPTGRPTAPASLGTVAAYPRTVPINKRRPQMLTTKIRHLLALTIFAAFAFTATANSRRRRRTAATRPWLVAPPDSSTRSPARTKGVRSTRS